MNNKVKYFSYGDLVLPLEEIVKVVIRTMYPRKKQSFNPRYSHDRFGWEKPYLEETDYDYREYRVEVYYTKSEHHFIGYGTNLEQAEKIKKYLDNFTISESNIIDITKI